MLGQKIALYFLRKNVIRIIHQNMYSQASFSALLFCKKHHHLRTTSSASSTHMTLFLLFGFLCTNVTTNSPIAKSEGICHSISNIRPTQYCKRYAQNCVKYSNDFCPGSLWSNMTIAWNTNIISNGNFTVFKICLIVPIVVMTVIE